VYGIIKESLRQKKRSKAYSFLIYFAASRRYEVRKSFANSRMRIKGRFVKKEDEELLSDLLELT